MTWRHLALLAVVLLAASGALASSSASAEGERPLPWSGGAAVETGAETLFGQAASQIAGRPVSIRCNGETDWSLLLARFGMPPTVWGYVSFRGNTPGGFAELSPSACWFLDRYAITIPKPAYEGCTATTTVTEWVQKQKRVRERKPLLKNGKPVLRKGKRVYVWKTRIVTTNVSQQRQRTVPVKCEGADEWKETYGWALETLAHESVHLAGVFDEAVAACSGIQKINGVALALGASSTEARIAAVWASWLNLETGCYSGGALDLTPGDGIWP